MAVKIFSVELSNTPRNQSSQQHKQKLITEFEALVNDFVNAHASDARKNNTNITITWLQSSDASSYGGSFMQLTAIVTYPTPHLGNLD